MLGGFSLGLIVALAIYLSQRPPGSMAPSRPTAVRPRPAEPGPAPVAIVPAGPIPEVPAEDQVAASEAAAEETRFDFYDVLPEFEVVVPDTGEELREDPRDEARARSGNYIVQAGAFRTVADADRMQAQLALLGFESRIQRVAIDSDVYHRVRIGPVEDLAELNRIRRRLRDEQIDYVLIDTPD
jgi:cell division protein FtsN